MRKMLYLGLGLLAMAALTGCAGVAEFNTPKEFQGQKVKEDPPGTMLPLPMQRIQVC